MAVKHFIQTVWSKKIQDDLELQCKLVDNCTREYEGEVKYARSVKILGVGDPTIGKYDPNQDIDIENMKDRGQLLTIDQANFFAFYVDDIDEAQSVPGLQKEYQRKAVHGLAIKRDSYVADLIKSASNKTVATALSREAVKEAIDNAIVALRERDFDEEGVIEITPRVYNVFKNELITLSTDNPEYIKKGKVGVYDDFDVIMSNNMAKDASNVYCDIRGKKAIAFAGQINEVEALRAEKRFKDIIRGLDTFGAKVIDEERIQVIQIPLGTTPADPEITNLNIDPEVSLDAPLEVGTKVATLSATGGTGTITYSLKASTGDNASFQIVGDEVQVKTKIESAGNKTITVVATDTKSKTKEATQTITIN